MQKERNNDIQLLARKREEGWGKVKGNIGIDIKHFLQTKERTKRIHAGMETSHKIRKRKEFSAVLIICFSQVQLKLAGQTFSAD